MRITRIFALCLAAAILAACDSGDISDPDAAFADPSYSSGCFNRPAGVHSITTVTTESPFGGGARVSEERPTADHPAIPRALTRGPAK